MSKSTLGPIRLIDMHTGDMGGLGRPENPLLISLSLQCIAYGVYDKVDRSLQNQDNLKSKVVVRSFRDFPRNFANWRVGQILRAPFLDRGRPSLYMSKLARLWQKSIIVAIRQGSALYCSSDIRM